MKTRIKKCMAYSVGRMAKLHADNYPGRYRTSCNGCSSDRKRNHPVVRGFIRRIGLYIGLTYQCIENQGLRFSGVTFRESLGAGFCPAPCFDHALRIQQNGSHSLAMQSHLAEFKAPAPSPSCPNVLRHFDVWNPQKFLSKLQFPDNKDKRDK